MKNKRLLEYKGDFLVFCKTFVPGYVGPPLTATVHKSMCPGLF